MCFCNSQSLKIRMRQAFQTQIERLGIAHDNMVIVNNNQEIIFESQLNQKNVESAPHYNIASLIDIMRQSKQLVETLHKQPAEQIHMRSELSMHIYVLTNGFFLIFETSNEVEWDQIDKEVLVIKNDLNKVITEFYLD
ncbi:Hypothetical_protein [Hexamita inflata]|uniref:Hypothetical_protein n=1 Tax=Hexamita inflata TaxID=28002 RepID=A0AA86NQL6_9EUKA|nr:Hypothetical protein HINF_LOCUS11211 [Hexamita inflata]